MGENMTAMRDPVFYRWHSTIQDMFELYKGTLPPYTVQQVCKVIAAHLPLPKRFYTFFLFLVEL